MNWKKNVWRNRKGASTLEYVVVITAAIILAMALYHTLTGGDVKASIQERVAAAFQLKGGAPPDSPQAQPSDQPANQTSDQKKPAEAPPAAPKPEEKSTGEKIVNGVLDFVGYHDAKAAITGVDENGNKVGVGERIFRGVLVLPIAKPVKGVKMATKYGDDVLAAGKKKFDDFARKGKKSACACPPASKLAPGGGLKAHEAKGGHLLSRHVNVTDQDLINRMKKNHKISGASRFKDRATAERVAHHVIVSNKSKIDKWLKDPKSLNRLRLNYNGNMNELLGRGLKRGSSHVQDMKKSARIILKKDGKGGYYVLTGFPDKFK